MHAQERPGDAIEHYALAMVGSLRNVSCFE